MQEGLAAGSRDLDSANHFPDAALSLESAIQSQVTLIRNKEN